MAMTLRLDDELQARLRAEADRTGTSQQEIVKRALRAHLSIVPSPLQRMIQQGLVNPPEHPRGRAEAKWSSSMSVMDLLEDERQERL